jgi:hypothetical protein
MIIAIINKFESCHQTFTTHIADMPVTANCVFKRSQEIGADRVRVLNKVQFINEPEIGNTGSRTDRMR